MHPRQAKRGVDLGDGINTRQTGNDRRASGPDAPVRRHSGARSQTRVLTRRARRDDGRSRHDRCGRGGLLVDRSRRQSLRRIGQRRHLGGLRGGLVRHLRVGCRHVGRRCGRGGGRLHGFRCGRFRGDRSRFGSLRIGCRCGHRGLGCGRRDDGSGRRRVRSRRGSGLRCVVGRGRHRLRRLVCDGLHGFGGLVGDCRCGIGRLVGDRRCGLRCLVGDGLHGFGGLRVGDRRSRHRRCLVRNGRRGKHGGSRHGGDRGRRYDRGCGRGGDSGCGSHRRRCGHRRRCSDGRCRGCNGGFGNGGGCGSNSRRATAGAAAATAGAATAGAAATGAIDGTGTGTGTDTGAACTEVVAPGGPAPVPARQRPAAASPCGHARSDRDTSRRRRPSLPRSAPRSNVRAASSCPGTDARSLPPHAGSRRSGRGARAPRRSGPSHGIHAHRDAARRPGRPASCRPSRRTPGTTRRRSPIPCRYRTAWS